MRIGYIGVGEQPRAVEVLPDARGSYLAAMQRLVGGCIEFFEPLYGTTPSLVVNEDGIAQGLPPNRAIYATREMEQEGYIDMMSYSHAVEEGELYCILFGPILAVPIEWDEKGNEVHRDITDEELSCLERDFSDVASGLREALRLAPGAW